MTINIVLIAGGGGMAVLALAGGHASAPVGSDENNLPKQEYAFVPPKAILPRTGEEAVRLSLREEPARPGKNPSGMRITRFVR